MRICARLLLIMIQVTIAFLSTAQEYHYYFGNLHAHSNYSDGCQDLDSLLAGDPAACFEFARKAKQFDFLGLSEHNHREAGLKDWHNWSKGLKQADSANTDSSFVALYGMEFGLNEFGHVLIYGIKEFIGWEDSCFNVYCEKDDYKTLWKVIDSLGGFATLAHPKRKHFAQLAKKNYDPSADKVIVGTAIANGPSSSKDSVYKDYPKTSYLSYYKKLLSLGYRVGPTIDHDNHNTTFGRTAASRTVVLAKALTRKDVLESYRSMRFYASDDWNAQLDFSIRGKPMGSEFEMSTTPIIRIHVNDKDRGEKVDHIRIYFGKAGSGIFPAVLASSRFENFIVARHKGTKKGETWYYFAEARQKDGNRLISAPIWVRRK